MTRPRLILLAIVSLLLGAIASTTLAMLGPRYLSPSTRCEFAPGLNTKNTCWLFDSYDFVPRASAPDAATAIQLARTNLFDISRMEAIEESIRVTRWSLPNGSLSLLDSGFPFRSITGWSFLKPEAEYERPFPRRRPRGREEAGFVSLPVRDQWSDPNADWIPYLPIWPGLLANAATWGAPAFFMLVGASALRRTLGIRRNHCVICNYDLSATPPSSPCPECGRGR